MAKRKHRKDPVSNDADEAMDTTKSDGDAHDDSGSGSDEFNSLLNVDFEYFDPQPAHDFHGLRTLLRQLLDADSTLFDLSALTDLILAQPLLGSTVKVDGNESDPFAFLTVLNLRQHAAHPALAALAAYLRGKAAGVPGLGDVLAPLLLAEGEVEEGGGGKAQVGLILTERLVNVPHEVVPPMYNMLREEMAWALEENEPYAFSHYLVLSKTYREVASSLDDVAVADDDDDADDASARPQKRSKKTKIAASKELMYFHPEDEVLQRYALGYGGFRYTHELGEGHADSKRAFQELGIRPQGHMVLIEAGRFEEAVKAVGEYLSPSS